MNFDLSENQINSQSSDEEYSDDKGEKKQNIPEYRKITNDSCYEFIIWANEKRNKSITVEHFNMIIQSNIHKWIQENNIIWQFALTVVVDTIINQKIIDTSVKENAKESTEESAKESTEESAKESTDEEEVLAIELEAALKPTSAEERRLLFAAAADKRASRF